MAGIARPARRPMIEMTTSSSTRVKADFRADNFTGKHLAVRGRANKRNLKMTRNCHKVVDFVIILSQEKIELMCLVRRVLRTKSSFLSGCLALISVLCGVANTSFAVPILRITEAMSSSGTGGTPDWFELSNVGDTAADITGYKMDDASFAIGSAFALNGVTSIAAGESVIFVESATDYLLAFNTFWGKSLTKVGYYSGSGTSLGSGGDGVAVFDSSGTEVNRVSFGAATTGTSFYWIYDATGALISTATGTLSSAGSLGATTTSGSAANTGSPGTKATALALAFTSSGGKFATENSAYSYQVTYGKRLSTDPEPVLSVVTKPSWLSLSAATYTLSGTPSAADIAVAQTVTLRLTTAGQTAVDQTYLLTTFASQPSVVLNEYNGVSSTKFLTGGAADARLGRIEGNGGNWFELVVTGSGVLGSTVDMRGFKIQISDVGTGPRLADTLTLSQSTFWQSVPTGTILTFTEDNTLAGGLDTVLNAENHLSTAGWAWSNIWVGDSSLVSSAVYVNGTSLSTIGNDDTQVTILNAASGVVFGTCGEGLVKIPSVNSTSVYALQVDPSSGVIPHVSTFAGFASSTFGRPNKIADGTIQSFFGKYPPYFVSMPGSLVKTGTALSSNFDFRQGEDHGLTVTIRVKGGGVLPGWISITGAFAYGATLSVSEQATTGTYAFELVLKDSVTQAETVENYNLVVLPSSSEVIVNEVNCVSSDNQINDGLVDELSKDGSDTFFGTVNGNGGGWLELVVVGDGTPGSTVDMRNWKIEIDDAAGAVFAADDTIVLSQDSYWGAVPAGTILTFTDQTTAQGGLDTWINKVNKRGVAGGTALGAGGYSWSNILVFDSNYVNQTASVIGGGLGISSSSAQIRILKADNSVVAGPVGEGVAPSSGVSSTEILELEVDPSPSISPADTYENSATDTVPVYGDGSGSTFGEPNRRAGGTEAQNFSAFGVANSAPTFANQPTKYAVEGVAYSWTATTADAEGSSVTMAAVTKPSWLSLNGKTLSGTPPQNSAGFYDVELSATDGASTTPLKFRLTVFNNDPSIILNEYNAVDNAGATLTFLNGGTQAVDSAGGTASDAHFGRVPGNGEDWVEFVVTGNGSAGTTDLRGYTIEIDEGASSGYFSAKVKIKLSTASFWAAVPNGTILTFTESKTAEGGMDTNLVAGDNSATTGQRWANVWVGDLALITYTDLATNGYSLTAGVVSGINIDDTETQFRVLNSAGYPMYGPAGEGIGPLNNISNIDVLELEGNPTASVLPTDRSDDTVTPPKNGYDNSSKDSTFGAPNEWHLGSGGVLTTQDFTPYKAAVVTDGYALYLTSKGLAAGTGFDARVNGVQVGLAYAFGTASGSPANNGVVAVPTMSGNEMTYVFDRVVDSALTVKAFTSSNLVTWTEVQVVSATGGVSPANFIKQKVVATGVGKLFVKISVTHP